jgi:hypothetical protein
LVIPNSMMFYGDFLCIFGDLQLSFQEDLSDRFGTTTSVVSSIFNTWIKVLAKCLQGMIHYPDRRFYEFSNSFRSNNMFSSTPVSHFLYFWVYIIIQQIENLSKMNKLVIWHTWYISLNTELWNWKDNCKSPKIQRKSP